MYVRCGIRCTPFETWYTHFLFHSRPQVGKASASRIWLHLWHEWAKKQVAEHLHWEESSLAHWRSMLLLHNLSMVPTLFCKEWESIRTNSFNKIKTIYQVHSDERDHGSDLCFLRFWAKSRCLVTIRTNGNNKDAEKEQVAQVEERISLGYSILSGPPLRIWP